jgi:hypothetical protein
MAAASAVVEHLACGLFLCSEGPYAWKKTLEPFTLWTVPIVLPGKPRLSAVFFDASGVEGRRNRRDSRQLAPLLPIPNWPASLVYPILFADMHQHPDQLLPLPASSGADILAKHPKHCKAKLPLFEPKTEEAPLLPEEVWAKRSATYNIERLTKLLRERPYPHSHVQRALLAGLREGSGKCVQLPSTLEYRVEPAANNQSAKGQEDKLYEMFMKNVANGTMAGPFSRPPWPNKHAPKVQAVVSPSGIARKNAKWAAHARRIPELRKLLANFPAALEEGKRRPTFDASAPYGDQLAALSVNARQRGNRVQMFYTTVETLATIFLKAGPGAFYITFDVVSAYNTLLVRCKDLNQFVVKAYIKDADGSLVPRYFAQVVHPFGTQDAPEEWQIFANVLLWILATGQGRNSPKLWAHYVDNFWAALAGVSEREALEEQTKLHSVLDDLGVPFHQTSCKQNVEAIGWIFSSVPVPTMAFKRGKFHLAVAISTWLQTVEKLTVDELRTVAGFFSWISRPLPVLRPFASEAYSLQTRAEKARRSLVPSHRLRQGASILKRLLESLPSDHSFLLHRGHESSSSPDVFVRSDASGDFDKGAGALALLRGGESALLFSHRWTSTEHQQALRVSGPSSTQLEILALLLALQDFHARDPNFANLLVDVELDSKPACAVLCAGYSKVAAINSIVQRLFLFLAKTGIVVRPRQVLRDKNSSADALSKQQLDVRTFACGITPAARPCWRSPSRSSSVYSYCRCVRTSKI